MTDTTEPGISPFAGLLEQRVAASGEYLRKLETSPFKESRILRTAAGLVESGRFRQAAEETIVALARRGIGFEYLPKGHYSRGTKVRDGHESLVLDEDFSNFTPVRKLSSLLHRNMSLILQRRNMRGDLTSLRELLKMDVALAEAVRLGTAKVIDINEKEIALKEADAIEVEAKYKLASL